MVELIIDEVCSKDTQNKADNVGDSQNNSCNLMI